jgi:hypothetical protein
MLGSWRVSKTSGGGVESLGVLMPPEAREVSGKVRRRADILLNKIVIDSWEPVPVKNVL